MIKKKYKNKRNYNKNAKLFFYSLLLNHCYFYSVMRFLFFIIYYLLFI